MGIGMGLSRSHKVSGSPARKISTGALMPRGGPSPAKPQRKSCSPGSPKEMTPVRHSPSPGTLVEVYTRLSPGYAPKKKFRTVKRTDPAYNPPTGIKGDPDPFYFKIIRHKEHLGRTLVEVEYPGCTNYEGRKILLLDIPWEKVSTMTSLDPHFLDGRELHLLGRFEPSMEGWNLGCLCLYMGRGTPIYK